MIPGDFVSKYDWDDFKVFAAVGRTGSLRGAAKELGISSAAITRRMAKLETALRVRLFNRKTHGIELTADGQRALSFANAAQSALLRAAHVSQGAADTIEGECRIALSDGLGTYWLPRFLAAFSQKHPNIALRISSLADRAIAKSPSHDIQIQYTDTLDQNLVATRVAVLHFVLFASTEYLRRHGKPAAMSDLSRHKLVDLTLADSTKSTFSSLSGFSSPAVILSNSNGSHCEAIRWNTGVGLLPTYASLLYDNLVPVLPSVHYSFPVFLCYEHAVAKQPVVRATLDFLRSVVFARSRMPWFADEFSMPDPQWPAIYRGCVEEPPDLVAQTFSLAG